MNAELSLLIVFGVAAFVCCALLAALGARTADTGIRRYREVFARQARGNLEQMFLFIDPGQLWTLNTLVLIGVGATTFMITGNAVISAVACVVGFFMPRLLFKLFKWRRLQQLRHQMPDAIMLIAGALRAGASLQAALAQMVAELRGPVSQEFELFLREQRLGVNFDDALVAFEARVPVEEMALLAAALKVSRETGGNLAETLERLAETLRQKLTIEGKIRALTAQGKLQGIVMGALPLLVMYALFQLEPEAMEPLFHTWYGWATLGFIALMEFIGAVIIRKIVNIDV
jgi:tight adherence protein B